MSARYNAIVWINHREAAVFHVNAAEDIKLVIDSHTSVQRLHHQGHPDGTAHQPVDTEFFARIVAALNHTGGTLIAGPGEAKHEFDRYLNLNRPDLAARALILPTNEHPNDAELIALAREHFHVAA